MKGKSLVSIWVFLLVFSGLAVSGFTQETLKSHSPSISSDLSHLAVPKSLGKVDERFKGKDGRWIIHVQDVHAHVTAQENIAAILNHLNTAYGVKIVAMEGAWLNSSFPISWGLPQSPEKQMLAHRLLEDYYLTGPGFAALFSDTPIELRGIENLEIYEANRQAYLKFLAKRSGIQSGLASLASQIRSEKSGAYDSKMLDFDRALQHFREGEKIEEFLPLLMTQVDIFQISIKDLGQIELYKEIAALEKNLNKDRLKSESERLVVSFKRFGLSFEELLKSGKIPQERLENYPQCYHYSQILTLQEKISHREFFAEIETVIERVKAKLYTTEAQKTLDARSERLSLAKRLLLLQATPDDIKKYEAGAENIRAELTAANLGNALDTSLEFYTLAKKRDDVFFEKIAAMPENENIAVVTGGFHTAGLEEKFQAAGMSHIVITPDLGKEEPNEKVYFEKIKISPIFQPAKNAMASVVEYMNPPERFDSGFERSLTEFKRNKDWERAEKMIEAGDSFSEDASPLAGFLELTHNDQIQKLENLLDGLTEGAAVQTGQPRENAKIMIKSTHLRELLKNSLAKLIWKNYIASDRNTLLLVRDEDNVFYPEMGDAKLRPLSYSKETGLEGVLDTAFKNPAKRSRIAIIDPEYKNPELLVLPLKEISLLLARLGLSAKDPAVLDAMQALLQEIFEARGFEILAGKSA